MALVAGSSPLAEALAHRKRRVGAMAIRALGSACLVLACGPRPGPPAESSAPSANEPANEPARAQPARYSQVLESQSFALICPKNATLRGEPPPEGSEAACVTAEGQPRGPSARWTQEGELVELHLFSQAGTLLWTLVCEQAEGGVAGRWRSGDEEELGTLESEHCEEIAQMLLGL